MKCQFKFIFAVLLVVWQSGCAVSREEIKAKEYFYKSIIIDNTLAGIDNAIKTHRYWGKGQCRLLVPELNINPNDNSEGYMQLYAELGGPLGYDYKVYIELKEANGKTYVESYIKFRTDKIFIDAFEKIINNPRQCF